MAAHAMQNNINHIITFFDSANLFFPPLKHNLLYFLDLPFTGHFPIFNSRFTPDSQFAAISGSTLPHVVVYSTYVLADRWFNFIFKKKYSAIPSTKFFTLFFRDFATASCFEFYCVFDNNMLEFLHYKILNNKLTQTYFHNILNYTVHDLIYFNSLMAHSAQLAVSSGFSNSEPDLKLPITPLCRTCLLAVGPGEPFSDSLDELNCIQPPKNKQCQNLDDFELSFHQIIVPESALSTKPAVGMNLRVLPGSAKKWAGLVHSRLSPQRAAFKETFRKILT